MSDLSAEGQALRWMLEHVSLIDASVIRRVSCPDCDNGCERCEGRGWLWVGEGET